ncbi:MAG: aminotransferase class I/II-fold pyridoxal phosphate-dependent enzyme [Clostridiales bacterium]|nr:aminotransferase class I/II-fold pyridoxal phosphate-dependent enzyme [Clostridiales bacterium]
MELSDKIKPARRVAQIKEYYFSRKLREVAKMNAEGLDVISLGIGGPDRAPSGDVIETLCEEAHNPANHSYQLTVGLPELREAYAKWYQKWYSVTLDPSCEIQPLIGSKEGILHVNLTFLNPGDAVLVPDPGYPTYTSAAQLVEAEVIKYDLKPENGWQPDFCQLERLPLDKVKLMWVNYPHMPTGTPASIETMQRLVDFGKRHGIVIAHDNPYSFILSKQPTSMLQIEGARDIVIEMNSLSKSHNMAGWRMAMVASNPTFINWIVKVKSNVDSGQFKPMMKAAIKALSLDKKWYDDLNTVYAYRREAAMRIMEALHCEADPNQQGLFLWGRIPEDMPSSEYLADKVLHDAHVFITPGFIFGNNGDRYIRISLCATRENMERALKRITACSAPA